METIEDDAAHLLRLLKVDNIVNFTPYEKNKTTADEMKTWFSNIPKEWRRKLYDIYRADFELFGYEYVYTLYNLYLFNIIWIMFIVIKISKFITGDNTKMTKMTTWHYASF